jgi:hypothetical protein
MPRGWSHICATLISKRETAAWVDALVFSWERLIVAVRLENRAWVAAVGGILRG